MSKLVGHGLLRVCRREETECDRDLWMRGAAEHDLAELGQLHDVVREVPVINILGVAAQVDERLEHGIHDRGGLEDRSAACQGSSSPSR